MCNLVLEFQIQFQLLRVFLDNYWESMNYLQLMKKKVVNIN
jgi:hypothetical protein